MPSAKFDVSIFCVLILLVLVTGKTADFSPEFPVTFQYSMTSQNQLHSICVLDTIETNTSTAKL